MQALRQIIDTQKLKGIIDIPDNFSFEKVEVLVLPVQEKISTDKKFNPDSFFSVSNFVDVEKQLNKIRDEWER
ncbi:hypothetical protein [Methyloprofundus sp.]|uniref:hypothetical protein n=1 Tax=Methyloprofundus sp. TaxID=2020875 RepID=UPI003D0D3FD8